MTYRTSLLQKICILWALVSSASFLAEGTLAQDTSTTHYVIDTEKSYIHVYTGVAGLGRSLAHSHLIAIRDIKGEVRLDKENAYASLEFFSANFLVDDDEERARSTDESFRDPVSDNIKTGTKQNMLGSRVLDADAYPKIALEINVPTTEIDEAKTQNRETAFIVEIHFKGETYPMALPANLEVSDTGIVARGSFNLDHSDLGLKPFSAAVGLARVAQALRFQFEIVAVATEENIEEASES